jgi:hypothetical protein
MAKRILNRRALREEADAAERQEPFDDDLEVEESEAEEEGDEEAEAKPVAKKKPAAKRKSRAKVAKEVRLKAFWGVFNQSLRRISLFEYHQRAQADKKAAELSESQKTPHFVQLVKEVIEE